jgi:carboxyl-terminal processing protease
MGNKVKNIGLIGLGMVAGVAASFQFSAIAQKVTAARCRWKKCASCPTCLA